MPKRIIFLDQDRRKEGKVKAVIKTVSQYANHSQNNIVGERNGRYLMWKGDSMRKCLRSAGGWERVEQSLKNQSNSRNGAVHQNVITKISRQSNLSFT